MPRKAEGKTFDVVYAGCSFDPNTEQLKLLPLGSGRNGRDGLQKLPNNAWLVASDLFR